MILLAEAKLLTLKTLGWMDPFNPKEIGAYLQRVEFFLTANDIAADKQIPVFLTVISGEVYS